MTMKPYRHMDDLAKDNPSGMDTLANPHGFSNNPGFIQTQGTPMMARTGGARTNPMRITPDPVIGRTASAGNGSVAMPAPGRVDPGGEGSPLTVTSGYSG